MGYSKYEMLIDLPADNQNLTPYSENQFDKEFDMLKQLAGLLLLMNHGIPPPESSKCQASHYNRPEGQFHQQPALPSPQTIVITPVEANEEPDFMGLSFSVTLFCWFIPGSIAFFFSKKTQSANLIGDRKAAQRNSKIAFILSMMSLATGVVIWIVYFVFRMKN